VLRDAGATALMVTHDQEEALMAVYQQPATAAVATSLGDAVLLDAVADGPLVATPLGPLTVHSPAAGAGRVLVRPEQLRVAALPAHPSACRGRVREAVFVGLNALVGVVLDGHPEVVVRGRVLGAPTDLTAGTPIAVSVSSPVTFFPEAAPDTRQAARLLT